MYNTISNSQSRGNVVAKITCLVLVFLAFFGMKILSKPTHSDFVLLPLMILLTVFVLQMRTLYSKLIIIYLIFVALSCIYSHFYNHQSLLLVVAHSYDYFALLFFFYLMRVKPTVTEVERVLIRIAAICCCCYILQWFVYPTVTFFFSADDWIEETSMRYRARTPGSICCYCLLLYGINKYILTRKMKYVLYFLLGFIPVVIMGFRTLVSLSALASFLMVPFIVKNTRKTMLYSLLGAVLAYSVLQTPLVKSKLMEMQDRQESGQNFENDEYIRYRELDYYWNEFFTKPGEKIFGGGVPADMSTKYRREIYFNGYTFSDLGMVGYSMIIGIPAVIILVLLYLFCIWRYKEPQFQYLRFTMLIVLLGSIFTTAEMFREGNILLLSLFIYIEYRCHCDSPPKMQKKEPQFLLANKNGYEEDAFEI